MTRQALAERVLRAMDRQVLDHCGPEFQKIDGEVSECIRDIFDTVGRITARATSEASNFRATVEKVQGVCQIERNATCPSEGIEANGQRVPIR